MIQISPQLQEECFMLGKLLACYALLKDEQAFPWLILVPNVPDCKDIDDIPSAQRLSVMEDIARCSQAVKTAWHVDKINVASIGNIVSQCHIHIVGRRMDDPLWPKPVWGAAQAVPYIKEQRQDIIHRLKTILFQDSSQVL